MSITLDGITLPADLEWVDEFSYSPVRQKIDVATNGAAIIEEAARLKGRPITLEGGVGACWIPRTTLDALVAAAQTADHVMTLNYHGTAYTVRFRHTDGPVEASQVFRRANPEPGHFYENVTVRLIEV